MKLCSSDNHYITAPHILAITDSCNYISSPGLSCDAMFKVTGVELKFILDIDIYLFAEKGKGGEISYAAEIYNRQIINT